MEDNDQADVQQDNQTPNEITNDDKAVGAVQHQDNPNTNYRTIQELAQPQNTTSSVVITYPNLVDAVRAGQVGSAACLKLIITSLQRINVRPRQPLCLNFVDSGLTMLLGRNIVFYGGLTAHPNSLCEVLTRDFVMSRDPSNRGPLIKFIRRHFKLLEGGAVEVDGSVLQRSIQVIEEFENGQDPAFAEARESFTELMASLNVDDLLAQVLGPGVEEGETTEEEEEVQVIGSSINLLGSSSSEEGSGSEDENEEEKEVEDDDAAEALSIDNDREGLVDALGGINNDIFNNNNNGVNHLLSYLGSSSSEEVYSSGSDDDNDQSQSSGSKVEKERIAFGELTNR